jgi:hypothetical protein
MRASKRAMLTYIRTRAIPWANGRIRSSQFPHSASSGVALRHAPVKLLIGDAGLVLFTDSVW